MTVAEHRDGNYRYLPGIAPYSCGVAASPGFEIQQVTFRQPVAYRDGFQRIADHLLHVGRPQAALCGTALRCPRPYSFDEFADFNREYTAILRDWKVFDGDVNPIARTNVAPVLQPPDEPLMYGFSYTTEFNGSERRTFVLAGAGELPEGMLSADGIVSRGDTSTEGLRSKAEFVMQLMLGRLRGLGVAASDVTVANVYTHHAIRPWLQDVILTKLGDANVHGIRWYDSQPPVAEIEFEMDMRGTRMEWWLD